jgi:CheY-like chemotaxis protein
MPERSYRVVLVEDNDDDADLVARAVRRFGQRVELAWLRTIPSAIERLKGDRTAGIHTDLVLIDGKIDGVGAEVFFEMAESEGLRPISCVVLKGCADAKTDSALLQMGARQVRSKPVDYSMFLEEIADILVSFCPALGTPATSVASDLKK